MTTLTPGRIVILVLVAAAVAMFVGVSAVRYYELWRDRRDQLIKDKLARRYNMAAFHGTKERLR